MIPITDIKNALMGRKLPVGEPVVVSLNRSMQPTEVKQAGKEAKAQKGPSVLYVRGLLTKGDAEQFAPHFDVVAIDTAYHGIILEGYPENTLLL